MMRRIITIIAALAMALATLAAPASAHEIKSPKQDTLRTSTLCVRQRVHLAHGSGWGESKSYVWPRVNAHPGTSSWCSSSITLGTNQIRTEVYLMRYDYHGNRWITCGRSGVRSNHQGPASGYSFKGRWKRTVADSCGGDHQFITNALGQLKSNERNNIGGYFTAYQTTREWHTLPTS